jgi:sulfite reductase (NADPH) flavoprotein alpha-component
MNQDPSHLLVAATAIVAWLTVCALTWMRARARRRDATRMATAHGEPGVVPLLVAHASQTGTAEAIAAQTAAALQAAGMDVVLRSFSHLDAATLAACEQALFVTSTYGEGDPPDAAAHFVASVMRGSPPDLARLRYGLLALGDRTYRNFCGFGRGLDEWLQQRGAQPLFDRIDVDNADPQALQAWRREVGHVVAITDLPEWQDVPFDPWVLRAREQLNPGSQGAPVFHLELVRQGAPTSGWEAGDLLQVLVPADPARPRDYSIASIPADGAVHLLVRLQVREDGSIGGASGWLTRDLAVGDVLRARLRVHSSFRIGDNAARDLVLIGNGTGIAGLRAHLKQRAVKRAGAEPGASPRHWLLFGERQAAHDALYSAELQAFREAGLLTKLDLVYSRDGGAHRYVQQRLQAEAAVLREWIDAGAAIYVCGSLEGMAGGVDEVLRGALGAERLAQLQRDGRYRRDVY